MQKLSKFVKKNIIGFIIGGIFAIALGVSAATVLNGTQITYKNSESVQAAIDRLYGSSNPITAEGCTAPVFNVGDYIEIKPNSSSYKISTSLTGYSSEQEITPNELTLWRVINKTPCNVEVVSEYTSSTSVHFGGKIGYKNYVGALNEIAKQYMNARLTSDARMVGFNGQTEYLPSDPTTANSGTTSTTNPTTGSGSEVLGGFAGDTLYLKDYQAINSVYGSLVANKVNATTTAALYWLASRKYENNGSYYRGRVIDTSGVINDYNFGYYNSGTWTDVSNGVANLRPILTLKSGLTAKSGTGAKGSPYKL